MGGIAIMKEGTTRSSITREDLVSAAVEDMENCTVTDTLLELEREFGMRKQLFPGLVIAGKLPLEVAIRRMAAMANAIEAFRTIESDNRALRQKTS